MSLFSRVAWKEGMFMVPQHFQQMERCLDAELRARFASLHPYGWGIHRLEVNGGALAQNRFELLSCQAVMPDGLVLDIPHSDAAPRPRTFDLGPGDRPLEVFLAVPGRQARLPLMDRDEERADVRFIERQLRVADEHLPDSEEVISVAAKNVRLLLGHEPRDGKVAIPLAQIERGPDGAPVLRRRFVPPALSVQASPFLEDLLRSLVEVIEGRAQQLTKERSIRSQGALELSSGDVIGFWLLFVLNQSRLLMRQYQQQPVIHPFLLFQEMQRLAGALSTFTPERFTDLQLYDHSNATIGFLRLYEAIRAALTGIDPTSLYEIIPMTCEGEDAFWVGAIPHAELLEKGNILLEVSGDVRGEENITNLMRLLKIADPPGLEGIVTRSLPGLSFSLATRLPPSVPVQPDACQFLLRKEGPIWEQIKRRQALAAFVPAIFRNVRLRLIGIRGGKE